MIVSQEEFDTNTSLNSILMITSTIAINFKFKDMVSNLEELEPKHRLPDNLKPEPGWQLPTLVKGEDDKFDWNSHVSVFRGKNPYFNYLSLAKDIAELNELSKWPSRNQVRLLLAKNGIRAKSFLVKEKEEVPERLVKDYPIQYVLEVLFGNPNINWKTAAALVRGLDMTGNSDIYSRYAFSQNNIYEDFTTKLNFDPIYIKGQNFDRGLLFNKLMQVENRPIDKVPRGIKLDSFDRTVTEWNLSKPFKQLKEENLAKGTASRVTAAFTDQVYGNQEVEYDLEDYNIINPLLRARLEDQFYEDLPAALFLYTLKNHSILLNWRKILKL